MLRNKWKKLWIVVTYNFLHIITYIHSTFINNGTTGYFIIFSYTPFKPPKVYISTYTALKCILLLINFTSKNDFRTFDPI